MTKTRDEESAFDMVQRVVKPVKIIAEMMRVGDTDQAQLHELAKLFLAMLLDLGEGVSQSLLDSDASVETREKLVLEIAQIVYSLRDYLSASATAGYNRQSNADAMEEFADGNATAIFVTENQFKYACVHVPTIKVFNEKVDLDRFEVATKLMVKSRVMELRNRLDNVLGE